MYWNFSSFVILHILLILKTCLGDGESYKSVYYTQALLTISYRKPPGEKMLLTGRYGDNSLKENANGYIFYSKRYGDWCKDLGPPKIPHESMWIALIPSTSLNCTNKDKMLLAKKYNASAVIIYNVNDPTAIPIMKNVVSDMVSVMVNGNSGRRLIDLMRKEDLEIIGGAYCEIIVGTHYVDSRKEWKVSKTSVLFVLVSFILLMCISLAWLVFYYVQRFRHIYRNDRKEKQLLSAAKKAISKLKTKSYQKVQCDEDDSCAICLDGYKEGETLRVLPCKHEFHKSCIDPWLLTHRTCPMCKSNILKALGVELPDDVTLGRHDYEQAALRPVPSNNQITMEVPRTPQQATSSIGNDEIANDTAPPLEAWKENPVSSTYSTSSSSVVSSEDTDSERSTRALVSPQRV